jgi:hypothetical protein
VVQLEKEKMPEGVEATEFIAEYFFQIDIQEIAERGQIEKMVSQFLFHDFITVLTQFSFKMRTCIFLTVLEGSILGEILTIRIYRNTSAMGDRFGNCTVYTRC